MSKVILIIILIAVLIAIFVVVWFLLKHYRKKNKTTEIPTGKSNQYPTQTLPIVPSMPPRENSNESSSYLPYITPYPAKPPPLGFGHPDENETTSFNASGHVDAYLPTRRAPYPTNSENSRAPYPLEASCYPPVHIAPYPDENETSVNANGHVDAYPPTRRAPYPSNSENSRAPYPLEASCYPPAHTAPYPLSSSMPQPSTSRTSYSSRRNAHEISNSTRITPYSLDHETPHPFSDEFAMPQPYPPTRRALYPTNSENSGTPYPIEASCYPPAHTAPYPDENETSVNANGHVDAYLPTRRAPYPSNFENSGAPYPLSNSMPQPSTSRTSYSSRRNAHETSNSARITPYPLDHETPYPFSDEFAMPQPYPPTRRAPYPTNSENSRAPYPLEASCYPPAHTAPYPLSSSMPQPSTSSTSYSSRRNAHETSNSTRITPYPLDHETPYPFSDEFAMPHPSFSRTRYSPETNSQETRNPRRTLPHPPVRDASRSTTQSPPSYEEAMSDK